MKKSHRHSSARVIVLVFIAMAAPFHTLTADSNDNNEVLQRLMKHREQELNAVSSNENAIVAETQPKEATDEVKLLIVNLQKTNLIEKVNAALELSKKGGEAVPAIPFLMDNLGDTRDGAPPGFAWRRPVYTPQISAREALEKIIPLARGWGFEYAQAKLTDAADGAYAGCSVADKSAPFRIALIPLLPLYGERAIPLLIKVLITYVNFDDISSAAIGLSQFKKAGTGPLMEILNGPVKRLHGPAAEGLINAGDPEVMPLEIVHCSNPLAYYTRGILKQKKGDYDGAIADYSKAIDLDSKYTAAYDNRGMAEKAKGDLTRANADFVQSAKLHFKLFADNLGKMSPEDYMKLSVQYYNQGRYPDSIAAAEQALQLRPGSPEAYNNICAAYNQLGEYDKAILACEQALQGKPDFPVASNNMQYARQRQR